MASRPIDEYHLQRWLTAAVLLPLLLLIIALGPDWLVLVLVLVLSAGGLLECFALLLGQTKAWVQMVTLFVGLLLPLASYWKGPAGLTAAITAVVFVALSVHLLLYAREQAVAPSLGTVVFAQCYVPFALSHIVLLLQLPAGRRWIFFVLFVIFAGDTAAYYVGYRLGRRKLFPAVSPGKTVEGAVGGFFSSVALAVMFGKLVLSSAEIGAVFLLILGATLALAGQMGDLMESMLKRLSRVKDTSGVLPGHGGLLDRLDSLIFAFPLTYYGIVFFSQ